MQEAQECDVPPDLMATGVSLWCPEPDLPQHPGDPQVLSPSPPITSSWGCLTPKQGGFVPHPWDFFVSGAQLCSILILPPLQSPASHTSCPSPPGWLLGFALRAYLWCQLQPRWSVVADGEAGGGISGSFLRAPTQRDAAARATHPPRAGFAFGEALS